MPKRLNNSLVLVVGPTASGKTALAQGMAEQLGASVLSADSMQIYRGMDIGTGKIPVSLRSVPYYGLDLADPSDAYSASQFQKYGRALLEDLDSRGQRMVVCGGTGFYVRALVDDFEFLPGEQVGNPIRSKYQDYLKVHGAKPLWDLLYSKDPESAQLVPVGDSKRIVRALEMSEMGESYARQKEKFSHIAQYYEPLCMMGLSWPSEVLARRINDRVDAMIDEGLVEEVDHLRKIGFEEALTSSRAIGYKELFDYLNDNCSFDESVEHIKRATRQYAKRQRTWFRKDRRIRWIEAEGKTPTELLNEAMSILGQQERVSRCGYE